MNNKLNIEEIKYLIPDYITGTIDEKDRVTVEDALKESSELRDFYNETKSTIEFVSTVKFEEPSPQYWNSLLPRIHEKIETRSSKKFSWSGISAIWKIIVPVAAVILIFIIYEFYKLPENQISKKQDNEEQQIIKDTGNNIKNEVKEKQEVNTEKKEENIAKETPVGVKEPKENKKHYALKHDNTSQDNIAQVKKNDETNTDVNSNSLSDLSSDNVASLETEEMSVMTASTPGVLDDETETELGKLDNDQKDQLVQDLLKSDL